MRALPKPQPERIYPLPAPLRRPRPGGVRLAYSTSTVEARMRATGKAGISAVAQAKNALVECMSCGAKYPRTETDAHLEVCAPVPPADGSGCCWACVPGSISWECFTHGTETNLAAQEAAQEALVYGAPLHKGDDTPIDLTRVAADLDPHERCMTGQCDEVSR